MPATGADLPGGLRQADALALPYAELPTVVGLVIGLFLLTQTDRRRPAVYDDRDPVVR